jgi:hypothetical protein
MSVGIFVFQTHTVCGFDDSAILAKHDEDLGFESFWVYTIGNCSLII